MTIATVVMQHSRSTPGTHVFRELDDQMRPIEDNRKCKIGQLYFQRTTFASSNPPDKVRITVEVYDEG